MVRQTQGRRFIGVESLRTALQGGQFAPGTCVSLARAYIYRTSIYRIKASPAASMWQLPILCARHAHMVKRYRYALHNAR